MPKKVLPTMLRGRADCMALAAAIFAGAATAATGTASGLGTQATADLSFRINIEKFIYFRLGSIGTGTIDTVAFNLTPSIPGGPTAPPMTSNAPATWNGTAPTFAVGAAGNALNVEVRSNGGQISLRASATLPLASGANTIPLSKITVSTSDSALPAPLIPDAGTGASVNVAGGGPGSGSPLVTMRQATWTFSYADTVSRPAGVYSGQVTFTASTP